MTRLERNRRFLRDLFSGPFPGHAILVPVQTGSDDPDATALGDFTLSDRPVKDWVPLYCRRYELQLEWLDALDDDRVPYVGLNTNTGLFAAAFGCSLHRFEGSPAAARPLVRTASEADRLTVPEIYKAPTLARVFELGTLLRERLGPQVPIGVPDIQSPFDIAALIWNKQDFYVAIRDEPASVKRLVEKCTLLLKRFLLEFKREFANCNLCHCPYAWAPPELGCWLSEDEAGAVSVGTFEEFCLPPLVELSETFGGMFIHCCANADHQYENFRKVPNLRGLNRVFQASGPRPAFEAFPESCVFMVAWTDEAGIVRMLEQALPHTRFLFNPVAASLEEARGACERLRAHCKRSIEATTVLRARTA